MLKALVRNLVIMLGVAVPVLLISAPFVGWLLPSAWGGGGAKEQLPSFNRFLDSIVVWYPVWAVPALIVALLHQPILAIIPADWGPRTTRLAILGSSLGMEGLLVAYVTTGTSEPHVLAVGLALLPSALVYGFFAQPIRNKNRQPPLAR